jgi:Cys-tRNA(Pro)/Cys-tRNA(Cys) deacylase
VATRAINFLRKKQICFEVKTYEPREKGALFAAEALDLPPESVIKTLVVALGGKDHVLVLMSGDKELNLKKLANLLGFKRAAMADTQTAERLTGYQVGGISPFGTKRRFQVIMDSELLKHQRVAINGGGKGTMLVMSPTQIIEILGPEVGDLER